MEENIEYDITQEPIVLSKSIIDICLKTPEPSDTIALYTFLYYTAKWQKTNTVKANIRFIMKALKWGNRRVSEAKKLLTAVGLIKTVKRNVADNIGWYIEIKFIWSSETVKKIADSSQINGRSATQHFFKKCQKEHVPFSHTNALSTIIRNALSAVMKNTADREDLLNEMIKLKSIIPPDKEWILVFFKLNNFKSDPEKYFNHYQSVNWKKGNSKITDWQANAWLWESNEKKLVVTNGKCSSKELYDKLKSNAV